MLRSILFLICCGMPLVAGSLGVAEHQVRDAVEPVIFTSQEQFGTRGADPLLQGDETTLEINGNVDVTADHSWVEISNGVFQKEENGTLYTLTQGVDGLLWDLESTEELLAELVAMDDDRYEEDIEKLNRRIENLIGLLAIEADRLDERAARTSYRLSAKIQHYVSGSQKGLKAIAEGYYQGSCTAQITYTLIVRINGVQGTRTGSKSGTYINITRSLTGSTTNPTSCSATAIATLSAGSCVGYRSVRADYTGCP